MALTAKQKKFLSLVEENPILALEEMRNADSAKSFRGEYLQNGYGLIHAVVSSGYFPFVEFLVNNGFSLSERSQRGDTGTPLSLLNKLIKRKANCLIITIADKSKKWEEIYNKIEHLPDEIKLREVQLSLNNLEKKYEPFIFDYFSKVLELAVDKKQIYASHDFKESLEALIEEHRVEEFDNVVEKLSSTYNMRSLISQKIINYFISNDLVQNLQVYGEKFDVEWNKISCSVRTPTESLSSESRGREASNLLVLAAKENAKNTFKFLANKLDASGKVSSDYIKYDQNTFSSSYPNKITYFHYTPLLKAINKNNQEIVDYIVKDIPDLIYQYDMGYKDFPLTYAIKNKKYDFVNKVLENPAIFGKCLNAINNKYGFEKNIIFSHMFWNINDYDVIFDLTKKIFRSDVGVEIIDPKKLALSEFLQLIVNDYTHNRMNNEKVGKIKQIFDLFPRDYYLESSYANKSVFDMRFFSNVEIIKTFKKLGIDFDLNIEEKNTPTPLILNYVLSASYGNYFENNIPKDEKDKITRFLLDNIKHLDVLLDGDNVLHLACKKGFYPILNNLSIDEIKILNKPNKDGLYPLHLLCSGWKPDIENEDVYFESFLDKLKQISFDVNTLNPYGDNSLTLLSGAKNADKIVKILNYGAELQPNKEWQIWSNLNNMEAAREFKNIGLKLSKNTVINTANGYSKLEIKKNKFEFMLNLDFDTNVIMDESKDYNLLTHFIIKNEFELALSIAKSDKKQCSYINKQNKTPFSYIVKKVLDVDYEFNAKALQKDFESKNDVKNSDLMNLFIELAPYAKIPKKNKDFSLSDLLSENKELNYWLNNTQSLGFKILVEQSFLNKKISQPKESQVKKLKI